MIAGKKIVVVMPAYNAAKTLGLTYAEVSFEIVDEIILVDDGSTDQTVEVAHTIGVHHVIQHEENLGYGANQKTCYDKALNLEADIIVMLHPDYQYTPKLIPAMCFVIAQNLYPVVLASRMLGNGARRGGMPLYKLVSNRVLTLFQNLMLGQHLSEYHTGYRAFSRNALETTNYHQNSDDFVFDNEILTQFVYQGYEIGEITCPTSYFPEASSINFRRSLVYGLGVMWTSIKFRLHRAGIISSDLFLSNK
jgi:glycosyltransferase involved in cell wall biosynthesis